MRDAATPTFWTEGYRTHTYTEYEGCWYPYLLDRGVPAPHFVTKVKNLQSPAVKRGDLWRLNYNKTVSTGTPTRTQRGKLNTLFQISESDEEWILPPLSPCLRTQGRFVLLLNCCIHFVDKVTPLAAAAACDDDDDDDDDEVVN